ncbi:MAG TPA: endonuclease III domain-containing protein [Polyangia bacterium]|nr:endonuclease III domain-containing protein [Polyangia bacterium]
MTKSPLPGQAPFVPGRRIPLATLAERLYAAYGPQGWWPLLEHRGSNPTLTGRLTGYHPGDYSFPRTEAQRFEICCGAILTQNTAWPNVEKALQALADRGLLAPRKILAVDEDRLQQAIRPSGYFRAKARKLRAFCGFYLQLGGRLPSREELLQVWGVGPETADSIRLYAYAQTEMVVDAYTLRVLRHHGYQRLQPSYAVAKAYCERNLPRSLTGYQEFHAVVVEHAKRLRAAG